MQALAFGDTYRDAWLKLAQPGLPPAPLALDAAISATFSFPSGMLPWVAQSAENSSLEDDLIVQAGLRRATEVIEKRGADLIRTYPLVTGVAASLRFTEGHIKRNEPCITFFVSEKRPASEMSNYSAIPREIEGVLTDVVEAGTPQLFAAAGHTPGIRSSPVEPGGSVSHFRVSSGTFGCLVEDESRQYLLSCAHVLSDAAGMPGDAVLHPGTHFGGTLPHDKIAELTRTIPLVSGTCIADAGIAEVTDPSKVTAQIKGIGKPTGTRSLSSVGLLVQKSGDLTGVTHGVVTGIKGTIGPLQINGVANVYFADAIITTGMSEPGDSGSLLMDYQKNAIGLLFGGLQFGGSYVVSWYSPVDAVLQNLGVTLVT